MNHLINEEKQKCYRVKIYGVVQGVGFRPFIYNEAIKHSVKGWVSNQGSAVLMEIVGENKSIRSFLLSVIKNPPTLAKIERVMAYPLELRDWNIFTIKPSTRENNGIKFIGADVSVCPDCIKDVLDSQNKRHNYAFTNCTNCGPRYSLIKSMPYDRENTTMEEFEMCPKCQEEYNNPKDRRFHAQTNCCPHCGPKLSLLDSMGQKIPCKDEILKTADILREGKIVAIKGIGGFHLACDAYNEESVHKLRHRKKRPHKPFAIMVKDVKTVKKLCNINEYEEKILESNKRPIVLLEKKENLLLPHIVAPNTKKLGVMLPYTPFHILLFQNNIDCLVMTSGNISNSPIQYENENALESLKSIADYFLVHNRDIQVPVEDSVVKTVLNQEIAVRAARGYSPSTLPIKTKAEILAMGAEEKSAFCMSQNKYLYMSQYIGDLNNYDTYMNYEKTVSQMTKLLNFNPQLVVHDMHESYQSSKYAQNYKVAKIKVQHHHAHMASCMLEHNIFEPVIGVIFDGTGLGLDGNIWGGEFLVGTRKSFKRVAHFRYVTIQGMDKSAKEPWRTAVSYLYSIHKEDKVILKGVDEKRVEAVKQALDCKLNCYTTSSLGRFFDCISSLLNICHIITYDAQAAIELENILDSSVMEMYPFLVNDEDGIYIIEYMDILLSVLNDMEIGETASIISAKFHNTLVSIVVDTVIKISDNCGLKKIVLGGGVFENNYLLCQSVKQLKKAGFTVYYNQKIPTNDEGICIGQMAIGEEWIK